MEEYYLKVCLIFNNGCKISYIIQRIFMRACNSNKIIAIHINNIIYINNKDTGRIYFGVYLVEQCLGPYQTSIMKFFCETINCFLKKAPSQMFDRILNATLFFSILHFERLFPDWLTPFNFREIVSRKILPIETL